MKKETAMAHCKGLSWNCCNFENKHRHYKHTAFHGANI